jgi:hypothetical protein
VLNDSGRSDSDGVSHTTVVGVQGLEAQGSWSYSVDGANNWLAGGTVTNGQSSVTLLPGTYASGQLQVRQTDAAGNPSAVASNPIQWVIDNSAPGVSLGNVATDNVVNQAERTNGVLISGGSSGTRAGDVVNVTWGTTTLSTVVDSSGSWRVGFASGQIPTGEASSTVAVRITDLAGNTTDATQSVRIDTLAPNLALPTNLMPSVSTGLGGVVQGVLVDNILNNAERAAIVGHPDGTWTLKGSTNAEAGQAVTVYLNGKPYSGSVGATSTDSSREWTAPITSADVAWLVHGNRYNITVDTLDSAGNPAHFNSAHAAAATTAYTTPISQSGRPPDNRAAIT